MNFFFFFELNLSDEEIDDYNNGYEEIDPINYEQEEFEIEDQEFEVEDHEFQVEDHEFQVEDHEFQVEDHESQVEDHEFQVEDHEFDVEEEESFSISDEERKRQNLINEFIATEKGYIRDMEIVIDVSFMNKIESFFDLSQVKSHYKELFWKNRFFRCLSEGIIV